MHGRQQTTSWAGPETSDITPDQKGKSLMRKLRAADLEKMAPESRKAALADFVAGAFDQPNGEIDEARARLKALETRVGMTAAEAMAALTAGTVEETYDMCQLLHTDYELGLMAGLESAKRGEIKPWGDFTQHIHDDSDGGQPFRR